MAGIYRECCGRGDLYDRRARRVQYHRRKFHLEFDGTDKTGKIQMEGTTGTDIEMMRAAKKRILSVEEIVSSEEMLKHPEKTKVPKFQVDMVIEAPLGAHPTACAPHYVFDAWHIMKYMEYAASPDTFKK